MHYINPVTPPRAAAVFSCTVSEWDIKSNWTVQAMFYSDENCSVANGETSNYTMAQFMELYQLNGTCESLDSANASYAFRCINGLLGWAFYNESNSTCSEDVLYVSTDNFGCVVSSNDSEKYLGATCTGSMDISGGTDDDYTYWNGSDDDFYYYPYWNGSDDDFYDYPYWNGSDDDFVVWLDDDSGDASDHGSNYKLCPKKFRLCQSMGATPSFFFFVSPALFLSSFWTSRGHRCRPFSPPVLAFKFYRA